MFYRDLLGGRYLAQEYHGKPRDRLQIDADFNSDGRPDQVRIDAGWQGVVHAQSDAANRHWIGVQLAGVKSLKLAQDAEVEIKAGTLYLRQTL